MNNDYMQRVQEWLQTEDGRAVLAKMRENADQNINPLHDLDMRLFDSFPQFDYEFRPPLSLNPPDYDDPVLYWGRAKYWGCFYPPRGGG